MAKEQDRTYLLIIQRLMEYLEENNYKPGDKLPSEDLLASELYFGRPALREALRVMEIMGIVESTRGRSNVYAMDMSKGMLSFFTVFSSVYTEAYEGLSALRANIEVIGVESFIKNATDLDVIELEYIARKHLEEREDTFISCNSDKEHIRFHQTLLKYSATVFEQKYVALCICTQMLSPMIETIHSMDPAVVSKFREDRSHIDLIDSIKQKDVERAKRIARRHALYYSELAGIMKKN